MEFSAGLHRKLHPATLDRSSAGEDTVVGLASRAEGSALDALVSRAGGGAGPVDPPSLPHVSNAPEDLLPRAMAGDRYAISDLLATIRPFVVRYCRGRIGRQERVYGSADDVAQEVCLAVLTALPSYRDQGRPFLAFVYGIAAHKVADAHRSAARNKADAVAEVPELVDDVAGPEQRMLTGDLGERLSVLLRVLPDKQREIVLLRVVVGLSAEETAEAVGSTPGAVRVAQHRALTKLRQSISSTAIG